jgi:hypothetical protein
MEVLYKTLMGSTKYDFWCSATRQNQHVINALNQDGNVRDIKMILTSSFEMRPWRQREERERPRVGSESMVTLRFQIDRRYSQ